MTGSATPAVAVTVDHRVLGFVDALRAAGIPTAVDSSLMYLEAIDAVGVADPAAVYWAGRSTLIRRPEDIVVHDRVFLEHWGGPAADREQRATAAAFRAVEAPAATADDQDDPGREDRGEDRGEDRAAPPDVAVLRWSRVDALVHKDFADCTDAELAEMQRLAAGSRLLSSPRRSRRLRPASRHATHGAVDLHRTARASLDSDGELLHLQRTRRRSVPRRVVFLLDVSGSMEPYARALLRFVQASVAGAAVTSRLRIEAFAFGTRLTRLTRELSSRDPDVAMSRAARAVDDWSGGTRVGESLRRFNDEWGVRGMARGAVVVILSDGWDRGDPVEVSEQMRRLARVAHRVVWVNPLKASEGYAPIASGMAAALPHVDRFLEGHCLASLERLGREIAA